MFCPKIMVGSKGSGLSRAITPWLSNNLLPRVHAQQDSANEFGRYILLRWPCHADLLPCLFMVMLTKERTKKKKKHCCRTPARQQPGRAFLADLQTLLYYVRGRTLAAYPRLRRSHDAFARLPGPTTLRSNDQTGGALPVRGDVRRSVCTKKKVTIVVCCVHQHGSKVDFAYIRTWKPYYVQLERTPHHHSM